MSICPYLQLERLKTASERPSGALLFWSAVRNA
nr:MAG TPA: hypothetical protein [Caudoviricetes sp.]